ncbi:MAG: glucosamine-6-phosphate deaminase [Candidatus Latescibacteria bacterium]|nr:glucosamine-6-phosphate deaminase [Candidatus Latescibacterota bacterium]
MAGTGELTVVERKAVGASPFAEIYPPTEKINTIVVENFPALGKLAAMRFLEWAQDHPGGVISLPTGKTPEHFIRWVQHVMAHWGEARIIRELEGAGIDPTRKPDLRSLHFVQIDEFYPIEPSQDNSFYSYVNRFYIDGFGLDPAKALLINCAEIGLKPGQILSEVWPGGEVDLSLRHRAVRTGLEQVQQDVLQRVDQWCQEFEERVRALGGIGFFLGGIGPDGHVGFNVRGSDHFSTTRLTGVNYETQAAAAGDLGGIEVARKRLVITIGLGTIAHNEDCCALIVAAGESKAGIVAAAIEEEADVCYPASSLHRLPMARFYITQGAAKQLKVRQLVLFEQRDAVDDEAMEKIVVDLASNLGKKVVNLTEADFAADAFGAALLARRPEKAEALGQMVRDRLVRKIERGTKTLAKTRFLHTEPHHDDLMLGYLPYIVRHVRDASNVHYFVCFTGGFTAVTNGFIEAHVQRLRHLLHSAEFASLWAENYFDPSYDIGRNRDVWQYLDGVAADDEQMRNEGAARRFLRNLVAAYGEEDLAAVEERLLELQAYFSGRYPGQKDVPEVQALKSMCREWEAECIWGYIGWDCANVKHLRLGFYTGDIFTEEPTVEGDVLPVVKLLDQVEPDVVSVALDPEASGPDTHYKVLQAVTEALRHYEQKSGRSDIKVWGYRNVWFRFDPSEADIFVPVSLNMLSVMHSAFMATFVSQRDASFPSHEHDGPFSELARRVQVDQYQKIKTCLGREWFQEHPSPLIRATRGLVFIKEMDLREFYERSRALKQAAENR